MATSLSLLLKAFIVSLFIHVAASTSFVPDQKSSLYSTTPTRFESQQPHQPTTKSPQRIMSADLNVTILGGGNVGTILAQKLKESNKFASVTIAARNREKTSREVKAKGLDIDVQTMSDVLPNSQVVILATYGLYEDKDIKKFAASLGDMTGVIIIDATNPLGPYNEGLQSRTWEGISSGEKLQHFLPKSKVYKSFNTVGLEHMKEALGKDMLIAGDPDPRYRLIAEEVVKGVGFKPFYVGPIRYARNLEAMAELWIQMAIPGLGGRDASRNFWFSISGDP